MVTGASGFIGRHLVPELVRQGFPVRAVSRRATRYPGAENIVRQQAGAVPSWSGLVREGDTIIHLAGLAHFGSKLLFAGRSGSSQFVDRLRAINVFGSESLAREVLRGRARRLIFISSLGAVASSSEKVIHTKTRPFPESAYGKSKLEAEEVLRNILNKSATELVIIRPPLVYGQENLANMRRLMLLVASGLPIPLASVQNRRSLVYVGNLISLIVQLLHVSTCPPWPVLVSDGTDISTPDLIRLLGKYLHKEARLFCFPVEMLRWVDRCLQAGVYQKLCQSLFLDMKPTQEFFQWHPPFSLEEGLEKTVQCFLAYPQ